MPGVKYKAVKGKHDFATVEHTVRKQSRSKYGVKLVRGDHYKRGK